MYTEENERGRFPLRDILLKAIVVIIFLILIIFIISKLTAPSTKLESSTSNYDKVFSENLKKMEDAAFKYYTEDRLPTDSNLVSQLTLRDMINSNLLDSFTDANGKACNVNKSYVKLTKNDDDYTLKVNLVCDEKEDYSLMKVGKYDYCKNTICEKDATKEKEKEEETNKKEEKEKVDITEATTSNNNSTINNNSTTNNNSSNSNQNSSNNTVTIKTYEYKKVTNPVLSGWSSWSEWKLNGNNYPAIKCSDTDANCLKEIQLFSRIENDVFKDSSGNYLPGIVEYYSYRTRTIISSGSIDIKWSYYNDLNLINQGYGYTGNYK